MRPGQPDVHRQPAAAARESDDGRAVEARRLEPPGAGPQAPAAAGSNASYDEVAGVRGGRARRRRRGAPTARPCPRGRAATSGRATAYASTPSSSTATGIAPADCAPSTIDHRPRGTRQRARAARPAAPRPSSTARGSRRRPGRGARARPRTPRASARRRRRRRCRRTPPPRPSRSRSASSGPSPPGCSWLVVSTRSPAPTASALTSEVDARRVVEWVSAMSSGSATSTAATRGAGLRHPLQDPAHWSSSRGRRPAHAAPARPSRAGSRRASGRRCPR